MLRRAEKSNRIILGEKGDCKPAVPLSTDKQALQAVQQAAKDAPVLSIFRQRLEKLHSRVDRTLDRAESAVRVSTDLNGNEIFGAPDLGVIAPLLNQAHKNLEILGRATGELEPQGGQGVSIQIICPATPNPDAMPRVSYAAPDQIEGAVDDCAVIGVIQK